MTQHVVFSACLLAILLASATAKASPPTINRTGQFTEYHTDQSTGEITCRHWVNGTAGNWITLMHSQRMYHGPGGEPYFDLNLEGFAFKLNRTQFEGLLKRQRHPAPIH